MISIDELSEKQFSVDVKCKVLLGELFDEETLQDLYSNALELELTEEQLFNYLLIRIRDEPKVLLNVMRYKGDFSMDLV